MCKLPLRRCHQWLWLLTMSRPVRAGSTVRESRVRCRSGMATSQALGASLAAASSRRRSFSLLSHRRHRQAARSPSPWPVAARGTAWPPGVRRLCLTRLDELVALVDELQSLTMSARSAAAATNTRGAARVLGEQYPAAARQAAKAFILSSFCRRGSGAIWRTPRPRCGRDRRRQLRTKRRVAAFDVIAARGRGAPGCCPRLRREP